MLEHIEVDDLLAERAYAKINLTLDVLSKRPDGYHEVDMVMQTVDLSDLIWIEETGREGIEIDATVSHIPLDSRNLAALAASAFMCQLGVKRGIRIRIEKNIPVAAGLGGGSSDAAAVLRGLNRLWDTRLSLQELAQIGASVGSDVPFCVYSHCAVGRGRGELIERVEHTARIWCVLVRPAVFVSTSDVYGGLRPEDFAKTASSHLMVEALVQDNLNAVRNLVTNSLQLVTMRLYPEVERMKEKLQHIAKLPVFMSGSGPTLYVLLPTQSAAQRLYNAVRGFCREVYLCRFI